MRGRAASSFRARRAGGCRRTRLIVGGMTTTFWARGKRHEKRTCIGCGGMVTSRPLKGCPEPRHLSFHDNRRAANNKLRRDARAAARAAGTVKRYGTVEAKKAQAKRAYRKRRIAIIERLGSKCEACGHTDHRALQVHHRHGGGSQEREAKGWRYHLDMAKLSTVELAEQFRLLCANCHQVEHYEAGEDSTAPDEGV